MLERTLRAVFFDFGGVIGHPPPGIDRKYFYLDWDGIGAILLDRELSKRLRPGNGQPELVEFFEQEIYGVFVQHEQTDGIDPQSNKLLLNNLHKIFNPPIDQPLVDQVLIHLDTMKMIAIDSTAVGILAELRRRGYRLGLVSNMMLPGRLLIARLQAAHLFSLFHTITISSDVGFIKPHPGIFHRALTDNYLTAREAIFVGDTYHQDILGAKGAGMKTVWLHCLDNPPSASIKDLLDFEIEALNRLLEIL